MSVEAHPDPRIERVRAELARDGLDAVVLTHPNDVVYATGYGSVLERWGLQEPLSAAIVARSGPVILLAPQALLGLLPLRADGTTPVRADELRVFELLNFCQMGRAPDPDAKPSALADAVVQGYGDRIKGECKSDVMTALAAALRAHGLGHARIGFDDLRVGTLLASRYGCGDIKVEDALDAMVRARIVKTAPELATFRRIGVLGDAIVEFAASRMRPGAVWSDVQCDIADFMTRHDVIPVDDGAMLFGGAFHGEFLPEIFRTRHDGALAPGQIVILEMLGLAQQFWIDINRTAVLGEPTREFSALHDLVRDGFLHMVSQVRPGRSTAEVQRAGYDYLRSHDIPAPEKLIAVVHGIGHMPVEMPVGFPSYGLAGFEGFTIEKDMVLSCDYLYFGARHGPCHMENVYIVTANGAESTYSAPLELITPH
jgi:Xaa-Pro dipeptidase